MPDNDDLTFDSLKSTAPRTNGVCPRCGRSGKRPGSLQINLRANDHSKRSVTSRSLALCEPCSVETYRLLLAALEAEDHRGR